MTVATKKQPVQSQQPTPEPQKQPSALTNRQKNGQYTGSLLG